MLKEWSARFLLAVLVVAAVAIPVLAWREQAKGETVHAVLPDKGGWLPGSLKAEVGKPMYLRLTSDDVLHGFGLGQSVLPPVDIHPGEVTEITLTFDKPGRYTFYCTRWCSVDHWRMRGVIEVTGQDIDPKETVKPPLYVQLGLDIDAEHHADVVPEIQPSARRGAAMNATIPAAYTSKDYYLSHSPVELWHALRDEAGLAQYSDQDLWDLVALTWGNQLAPSELEEGKDLYAANCAACHGESGRGDGVYADELTQTGEQVRAATTPEAGGHDLSTPAGMAGDMTGEMTQAPTDFTDPDHNLAISSAHWQGKILRGGMGTGMPSWGPIFTEDQTWALVAYLWTFQFNLEK